MPPSAAKAAEYVHESFFDFKKFPQPVGETALQPAAFVATKPWRTPRFGEVKRNLIRGEGRGLVPEKMENKSRLRLAEPARVDGITEP